ncbi:hypothetical protein Bbelb_114680 [Branchiostoma belcheri]|nr:hypothetical protein Bbelb_114680 [Branchiostoma belcheri]
MCYQVECSKCKKKTWRGCGLHVESVMKDVPPEERSPGNVQNVFQGPVSKVQQDHLEGMRQARGGGDEGRTARGEVCVPPGGWASASEVKELAPPHCSTLAPPSDRLTERQGHIIWPQGNQGKNSACTGCNLSGTATLNSM